MELRNIHANCLKIKFSAKSKMPSDKEIFAFFRKRDWRPDMLTAMFREPREYSVYVKFVSEEIMKAELLKCPTTDTFNFENGDGTSVTFSTARGDFKYIRVIGLPIEVEDKNVASVLSKYGRIHQLARERYGQDTGYPILNGVRGAYMELEETMPSQLYVQRFPARIVYEGMQAKCFVCNSPDHMKQSCPKRTSVNDRLKQNNGSYAGIVSGRSNSAGSSALVNGSGDDQQAGPSHVSNCEHLSTDQHLSKTATVLKVAVSSRKSTDTTTETTNTTVTKTTIDQMTSAELGSTTDVTEVAMNEGIAGQPVGDMDVVEEDEENRKREHESTASDEQHDESESSSEGFKVVKHKSAKEWYNPNARNDMSFLSKQVKRLRSKTNNNNKK